MHLDRHLFRIPDLATYLYRSCFVSHLLHSAHFPESQAHKLDILVNELRNQDTGLGAPRLCNAAPTPQHKVCHLSFSDAELLEAFQPLQVSILCFICGAQQRRFRSRLGLMCTLNCRLLYRYCCILL